MRLLNYRYRGVDKVTDVLSFPLSDKITAGKTDRQCDRPIPLVISSYAYLKPFFRLKNTECLSDARRRGFWSTGYFI